MPPTFRFKRAHARFGIVAASGWSLVYFGSLVLWYLFELPPHQPVSTMLPIALFLGMGFGFFVGLSLWMVAAYYRTRLTVDDQKFVYQGVLQTRTVVSSDVTRLRWQSRSVRLVTPSHTLRIDCDDFRDRPGLMRLLRERFDPSIQEGWIDRCEKWLDAQRPQDDLQTHRRLTRRVMCSAGLTGALGSLSISSSIQFHPNLEPETWTGFPWFDWTLVGLLITFAATAGFRLMMWVYEPETTAER